MATTQVRADIVINSIHKLARLIKQMKHLRLYDKRMGYQLHEVAVLKMLIERLSIDCIFDIGAHRGQYARMLRNSVKYGGKILSVEPNPDAYERLHSFSKNDKNWYSKNVAISSRDGTQCLSIMTGDQFTSLSEPIVTETNALANLNSVKKTIEVRVQTLSSIYSEFYALTQFTRPFLKLDTQGYDAIIVGSKIEAVRKFVGVQTEVSFLRLYRESMSFEETCEFYKNIGFYLCAIVPNNAGHFPQLIEQDAIFVNAQFLNNQ